MSVTQWSQSAGRAVWTHRTSQNRRHHIHLKAECDVGPEPGRHRHVGRPDSGMASAVQAGCTCQKEQKVVKWESAGSARFPPHLPKHWQLGSCTVWRYCSCTYCSWPWPSTGRGVLCLICSCPWLIRPPLQGGSQHGRHQQLLRSRLTEALLEGSRVLFLPRDGLSARAFPALRWLAVLLELFSTCLRSRGQALGNRRKGKSVLWIKLLWTILWLLFWGICLVLLFFCSF